MMDKTKRDDMLRALEAGQITVTEACERYGHDGKPLSDRHVRRLLAAYRKPKGAVQEGPAGQPGTFVPGPVKIEKVPDVKPVPGSAPVPPSMSDIDKVLSAQNGTGGAGAPGAPDAALTADMALQGIRMAKMVFVLSAAEMLGLRKEDEKAIVKQTALTPVTESVIRMQKPEAWAKLGEIGASPYALLGVLILDTVVAGFALWKLRPAPAEDEGEKK